MSLKSIFMHKTLWVLLICVTIVRVMHYIYSYDRFHEGDHIVLQGNLLEEPTKYEYSQGIELQGVRIYVPHYPQISYGDYVQVEGIYTDGVLEKGKVLNHKKSDSVLVLVRNRIISLIDESLPRNEAGLTTGVVLGSRALIEQDFWEVVKKSGVEHVVVASGTNVVLVTATLLRITTLFIRRRSALVLVFLGVWAYTLLVGFEAPIIRATIMATSAFAFQWYGRVYKPFSVIFFIGTIMLVFVPSWIADVGFYLSFAATLGLMILEQPIEKRLQFMPKIIRGDLATTLSAQIAVSPILIFFFGSINFLSPFTNAFVLWTIVPLTILGFIGGVVGIFVPIFGKGIILLSYPFAWWFVVVVKTITSSVYM